MLAHDIDATLHATTLDRHFADMADQLRAPTSRRLAPAIQRFHDKLLDSQPTLPNMPAGAATCSTP